MNQKLSDSGIQNLDRPRCNLTSSSVVVDASADQVIDVPANPGACAHPDPAARAHVVGTYDFTTLCLPEHIRQMNTLVPKKLRIAVPG